MTAMETRRSEAEEMLGEHEAAMAARRAEAVEALAAHEAACLADKMAQALPLEVEPTVAADAAEAA